MSGRRAVVAKPGKVASAAKPTRAKAAAATPAGSGAPVADAASPGNDASAAAMKIAADIDRALARGETDLLSTDAIQALMAAACRTYAARVEAQGQFPPLAARSRVTSTDVMVTASGLLKAANLAVFELGMWQSWTGR
jgi:hypothetical protein